ncbi:very short patch repair endonuclease [Clavibacter michiganensis]|uniref:very short patch repair endonuclease n=1 Tax=Clavibacter michiganensis TaxID=28447 RepID=UPI001C2053A6
MRGLLHAKGVRYRVDFRPDPAVRSRADIVFTKQKVADFIEGCFWHGCPLHATYPKAKAEYWLPEHARNRQRDAAAERPSVMSYRVNVNGCNGTGMRSG